MRIISILQKSVSRVHIFKKKSNKIQILRDDMALDYIVIVGMIK